jgi:small-conductance mechanosensitive channel
MSSIPLTRRVWLYAGLALALSFLSPPLAAARAVRAKAAVTPSAGSAAAPAAQRPSPLLPLSADEVLAHVRRSVAWYHDLGSVEELSLPGVTPLARTQLQQQALTAVRLVFEFGKAAEDILGKESRAGAAGRPAAGGGTAAKPAAATPAAQLERAAASLTARQAALAAQIAALDAQLRRTRGARARAALTARRQDLLAAQQLLQQIASNIGQLRRFQESAIAGQGKPPKGLRAELAALEKSIPELATGAAAEAAPAAGPAAAQSGHALPAASASGAATANFQPQSAGIVTLIGRWFMLHGYQVQLRGAIDDTTGLEVELTHTRSQVLATVRRVVGTGMASIGASNSMQLAAQRQTIEAATAQLRQLSSVIIPLGEQALTVSSVQSMLGDWSRTLAAQESGVARYLGLRVGFLLGWIAAVLIISEIWRRATFRYLQDSRRRRPFLVLRRVVVGLALTLVVVFSLVSQFGSVATYAGFVTAGLAVALQNLILAIVAYFFLIGRYGVRVGDRVTISGVTGRVVDISLLRIYLMELSGPDLHSTGRMVVLSNAVLFQPTALFKQIPGAEYLWHSVTLMIVATADVEEAYGRLQSAANKVYDTYRAAIEHQHTLAQRFIEFETAAPVPEVRVRLTDTGLECAVRYPVVPEKSARIDQQMLEALRKAVERDEQLKLVASGGMVLKSSET